jgi:hypothetical protein
MSGQSPHQGDSVMQDVLARCPRKFDIPNEIG